jgi:hypothetical protein
LSLYLRLSTTGFAGNLLDAGELREVGANRLMRGRITKKRGGLPAKAFFAAKPCAEST